MVLQRITSITAGPRQSNFELLRILAMFLVLVVHSDFWSIGAFCRRISDSDIDIGYPFRNTMCQHYLCKCICLYLRVVWHQGIP